MTNTKRTLFEIDTATLTVREEHSSGCLVITTFTSGDKDFKDFPQNKYYASKITDGIMADLRYCEHILGIDRDEIGRVDEMYYTTTNGGRIEYVQKYIYAPDGGILVLLMGVDREGNPGKLIMSQRYDKERTLTYVEDMDGNYETWEYTQNFEYFTDKASKVTLAFDKPYRLDRYVSNDETVEFQYVKYEPAEKLIYTPISTDELYVQHDDEERVVIYLDKD